MAINSMGEFREKYPEYNDLSDDQVVRGLQKKFYPDMSVGDVAQQLKVYGPKYYQPKEPKPMDPKEQAISTKLGSLVNSDEYRKADWDSQVKMKTQFFNDNISPNIPDAYKEDYRNHFLETLRKGENEARYNRMKDLEKQFREDDPAYADWFSRTGQSVVRGLNRIFDGMEVWERKLGLVDENHYDNLRKGGWQDFGERYVRRKQYMTTGTFDEIVQTVAEFSPAMVAAGMGTIALGPAAPAVAATAMELGIASLTSIAAETGARRQELAADKRYTGFSKEQLDDMAAEYGIYSGAMEGVGTVVGLKGLKIMGSQIGKVIRKAPASKAAVDATNKLITRTQAFSNTKAGKYASLIATPAIMGATESGEEVTQALIGEAMHIHHLNPDMNIKDQGQALVKRIQDPEFQEDLKHQAKIAYGAGALIPGAMASVAAVRQAKADLFSGKQDIDLDYGDITPKLAEQLNEELKKETPDVETAKEIQAEITKLKHIEAAEQAAQEIEVKELEDEIKRETTRIDELIKPIEEQVKTVSLEAREAAPEVQKEKVYTVKEAPKEPEKQAVLPAVEGTVAPKEKPVFTDKQIQEARTEGDIAADVPVRVVNVDPETYLKLTTATKTREEAIKLKAPKEVDYKELKESPAPLLIIDEKGDIKGHDGRHRAATLMHSGIENMPVAVFGPKDVQKIIAQRFGAKQRDLSLNIGTEPTVKQPAKVKDNRPEQFRHTGLVNPKKTTALDTGVGSVFSREGKYEGTTGAEITDTREDAGRFQLEMIEEQIAKGNWKFQELFDVVVANSPNIEFVMADPNLPGYKGKSFRGAHKYLTKDDGTIKNQKVLINPESLDQVHKAGSAADIVMAHELLHALYLQRVGNKTSAKFKQFQKDIGAIWKTIPKETMREFQALAGEYYTNVAQGKFTPEWNALSKKQRSKREAWFHILGEANKGKFDEIMAYGLTDANIFSELYKVRGTRDLTGDSIAKRMMNALLKFFDDVFKPSKTIVNDLLSLHKEYAGIVEQTETPIAKPPVAPKPKEPKVTVLPAFTEEDFKAREAKGYGTEEHFAIAPDAETAAKKLFSTMGHLRENYLATGKKLPRKYADQMGQLLAQARAFDVLDDQGVEDLLDELSASELEGPTEFESYSLGGKFPDPTQAKMDELMPVKVKFDAYLTKDLYGMDAYQFTITDPSHSADRSTFYIPELTKAAIENKFKEIDRLYKPKDIDYSTWTRTDNNSKRTFELSEPNERSERTQVEMVHTPAQYMENIYEAVIVDNTPTIVEHTVKIGTPTTEIAWSLIDTDNRPIYDRVIEGSKVSKSDAKLGIATIKRIKTLLGDLLGGRLKADVPQYIKFSSTAGDVKKALVYDKMAKRIAKVTGWKFIADENGYHILNTKYKPTEEDISKATLAEERKVGDDTPTAINTNALVQMSIDSFIEKMQTKAQESISIQFMDFGEASYEHTDGGTYYDLDYNYDNNTNKLHIRGTHEMYDEIVELFNVDLPIDPAEYAIKINEIGKQLSDNTHVPELDPSEINEPLNADDIERRMEGEIDVDFSGPEHKFDDPEHERVMLEAEKGIPEKSSWAKVKAGLGTMLEGLREFRHLKQGQYADVQLLLRRLKTGRAKALNKAMDHLTDILKNLDPVKYKNLQRMAYLMDMFEQVQINKEKIAAGQTPESVVANPFNLSDDEIETEAKKIFKIVRNDPETWNAWRARLDTWFKIRANYKEAMDKVGFDVSKRLNRAFYFRHQVLEILQAEHKRYGVKGTSKLAAPTRRSYLRKRGAKEPYAMNLNYVQAEYEVMAQMIYDTHIGNTLGAVMEAYSSEDKQEGYELYEPREESIFYTANTVPGRIVQAAAESGLKALKVPANQIKQVLALGGKYQGYYLPKEIAATLNEGIMKRPPSWAFRKWRGVQTKWKMWQLLNPTRVIKYNVRNLTGDVEAIGIGNYKVFNEVPNALKGMYKGSKDWNDWLEAGGEGTTLQAQEMEQIIRSPEFKHLQIAANTKATTETLSKVATKLFNVVRIPTDKREQLFRFAAYLRYKKELAKNNGHPDAYTASLREEIEPLDNNIDKAFVLSNDLVGAYDRISIVGNTLRDYLIPFWSFQEVNLRRSITMFRNAYRNDKLRSFIGKKMGAKTITSAINIGGLALKFMAMSMIMQGYNEWFHEDREDALPDEMRERSHLILNLPWDTKGSTNIYYFPRVGITGDLLEWGGMETVPSDIRDIALGTKTITDAVKDTVIDAPGSIINKVVQSLGPQYKLPVELLMGEKAFPSVFNRQPITDRWRYVAEHVGAKPLYDATTGRPQKKKWAQEVAAKTVVYKEDINRFGWLAIQQKISEYMDKNKLKGKGFIVTETGNALYNIGLAVRYGDQEALAKYFANYVRLNVDKLSEGQDYSKIIEEQWDKLDPLARLNDTHRKLFLTKLDSRGVYQMALAYAYYAEIKSGKPFTQGRK